MTTNKFTCVHTGVGTTTHTIHLHIPAPPRHTSGPRGELVQAGLSGGAVRHAVVEVLHPLPTNDADVHVAAGFTQGAVAASPARYRPSPPPYHLPPSSNPPPPQPIHRFFLLPHENSNAGTHTNPSPPPKRNRKKYSIKNVKTFTRKRQ